MKLSDLNLLKVGDTIQMAGALYQGEGKTFLAYFPDEDLALPSEVLEMDRADWDVFIRQLDLMETEVLGKTSDGTLGKIILRKSQRQISQITSWAVWKRDGYRCRYCHTDSVPLTVDHIVCWEVGGPSIESNLLSACRKCNTVRGDLEYQEWLKHPHYRAVSSRLPKAVIKANAEVVLTLNSIPRMLHIPSHR